MALSQEDKHRILFHLCHSGKTLIEGSTHYNSVVASRLDNLNTYIESQLESLLEDLESTRARFVSSPTKSNVRRIGDIELDTDKSLSLINSEYKRLQNELSSLLDIPNLCKSRSCIGICGP